MPRFGPGLLVMAAFIGPGTVTTASAAGANFGFALLWALLFSVIATLVLQEMAARLGLVSGQGLASALRSSFSNPLFSRLAVILIIAAIGFGNAAYESGNITGAAMALSAVSGLPQAFWAVAVAGLSMLLLGMGRYQWIERGLVCLVVIMSAVFIITMMVVQPSPGALLGGLLIPSLPDGASLTVIALIGTTVVPYNLFLHSSAVQTKWGEVKPVEDALSAARLDNAVAVSLGGLITLAIIAASASAFFGTGQAFNNATISRQLEPLLGPFAPWFFAMGLFAAGLSSAIASPLAAAYAVSGAMGWPADLKAWRFRAVWLGVLLTGMVTAALGTRPITAIMFAQAANGFLLPLVAIFLLLVMNRQDLLGQHCNNWRNNTLGALVILVVIGLSGFKLARLVGLA